MEKSLWLSNWYLLSSQSFPQTCKKICWSLSIQFLYHGVNTLVPSVSHRTKCSVKIMIKRWKGSTKLQVLEKQMHFPPTDLRGIALVGPHCLCGIPDFHDSINTISLDKHTSDNVNYKYIILGKTWRPLMFRLLRLVNFFLASILRS